MHSLAHLLSKSATYSDILALIKSMNFICTIRVKSSQICISTQMDLFAQQEGMSLLKIPYDLKSLQVLCALLDSHIRFPSDLQISLLRLLLSAV